jgi:hypothetical protein
MPESLLAVAILALGALLLTLFIVRRAKTAGVGQRVEVPTEILHRSGGETTILLGTIDRRHAYAPKTRFLNKSESLLYYLLKTAVPLHEVFPRMRLADVLEVQPGPQSFDRQRAFRKIEDYFVDFVVCEKDMKIVAVIELDEQPATDDMRRKKLDQFKQECIEAAGIRYYRFPHDDMPRYRELRDLLINAL